MQTDVQRKRNHNAFFKGAAWIAAGGFLSKLIGALYRIPLTNLIGGYGMGLYQLVYPLYTLLLTVSATGIPSSLAKLTAERTGAGLSPNPLLSTAFRLFLTLGGVGTAAMAALAYPLSLAQGAPEVTGGYLTLAPSVLLVSAISVYRGYFQGKNDMFPTAASEIAEQLVKVTVGLPLAWLFRNEPVKAVAALLFAVSVAEGAALAFVSVYARKKGREKLPLQNTSSPVSVKTVLKLSVPVTLSSALLPLSGLVDSVLIVRLLSTHTQNAVRLYGLFSGGAVTLVNLPVSVCYGLAAASIPAVAAEKDGQRQRKKIRFSLLTTLAVSVPCALALFFLSGVATNIVFPSLGKSEAQVLTSLVRIFSVSAVTLSCTQTLAACLTALGKPLLATSSMAVAVTVKTLLTALWVGNPSISVYGAAMATNICYLVAFLCNLYYNLRVTRKRKAGARMGKRQRVA